MQIWFAGVSIAPDDVIGAKKLILAEFYCFSGQTLFKKNYIGIFIIIILLSQSQANFRYDVIFSEGE